MDSRMPDAQTALYCVLGNPIAHSLSPAMHNRAFAHRRMNAGYLAFRVVDLASAVRGLRALDIRGASITLPHKTRVMDYLDVIDPAAAEIGAVNTVVNDGGRLIGKNSDASGAVDALQAATAITSKNVLIIGAGGAARAVGFGIHTAGGNITITNRSAEAGAELAATLDGTFLPRAELRMERFDIVVNTTPVGMHPDSDATPVPTAGFSPHMVIMDIVYNPLETAFLKAAGRAGCRTIDGLAMFVNQGARQFEWWTGQKAPVETMRQAVIETLQEAR